jgi:hypothetical protein
VTETRTVSEPLLTAQNPLLRIEKIQAPVDDPYLLVRYVSAGPGLGSLSFERLLFELANDPVEASSPRASAGSA